MPTWNTGPKDDEGEKKEEVKGNDKASESTSRSTAIVSKSKRNIPDRKSESKTVKSMASRGKKEDKAAVNTEKEGGPATARQGHFGFLDAITPKLPAPPPPASLTSNKGSSSNSRKTTSTSGKYGGLSFTKSAPTEAVIKKRGSRKSTSSSRKKKEPKEQEQDDGEWDETGIIWKPYPKPEEAKSQAVVTAPSKEGSQEDQLQHEDEVTPISKGKGKAKEKDPITSSPSPPPTKLRTPALGYTAVDPKIGDETPLPLPPPQSRMMKYQEDPNLLLDQAAREDVDRQVRYHTLNEAINKAKMPLFLPVSPSSNTDENGQVSEEEEEEIESPVQRPITRRSAARRPSLQLTDTDDEDPSLSGGIPPLSFLVREEEEHSRRSRQREDTGSEGYGDQAKDRNQQIELVPASDDDTPPAPRHFGIELTPFINNSASGHTDRKSKSSSRKTKTYGKGRTHAYQHGNPLPHANSQSIPLAPPAAPAKSSYRGAKRKGSTSIWRESSPSASSEEDAVDAFDINDDVFGNPNHRVPRRKKTKRFIRNGPPPHERSLGLFGEDEDEPHRYRRKRGRTPKHPISTFFRWTARDQEEEDDDEVYDPDTERRRRKRRKTDIEKRHRIKEKAEPRLNMTRNKSCEARIDNYVQKIRDTLPVPKKPLRASKAVRMKSYKRNLGVPGYALKEIPTISYAEYTAQYQQASNNSGASGSSRPSNRQQVGGRVNELIAAGRRARYEVAIRKQRPITRDFTPRLPMKALDPTQDDPQNSDEIDVELSRPTRKRGSSLGLPLYPKRPPRLRFTNKDPPSQPDNAQNNGDEPSAQNSEPRNAASVLGHLFPLQPSRPTARKGMPSAFRQSTIPSYYPPVIALSDDTPESSRRSRNENDDPILQFTQASPILDHAQHDNNALSQEDPILPFSQIGTQSSMWIPSERPSEFIRRLDNMGQEDLTQNASVHPPTCIDPALIRPRHELHTASAQNVTPQQPSDQDTGYNGPDDNDLLVPFGSQIDWDAVGQQIGASQWLRLDDDLAREEADRESKRNSNSRDSRKENAEDDATHPSGVDAPASLGNTKNYNGSTTNDDKGPEVPSNSTSAHQPAKSVPTKRMTGLEVTQHLLQRPILASVAQNINKTFITPPVRGSSEGQSSNPPSRKARREERAKRVQDKRAKEKRREQQAKLAFTPHVSTSRNGLGNNQQSKAEYNEDEEGGDEVEKIGQTRGHQSGGNLPLSEAYRDIHPPPSRVRTLTSAPSRFSLSNKPVVRNFKEAKQPSIKALEERNRRASQEAVTRVFRSPIGRIESSSDMIGEVQHPTILEPTQLVTQYTPPSVPAFNYESFSRANSKKGERDPTSNIKAWRSEVRPLHRAGENHSRGRQAAAESSKKAPNIGISAEEATEENIYGENRGGIRNRNQGGNPWMDNLSVFPHDSQIVESPISGHRQGAGRGRGKDEWITNDSRIRENDDGRRKGKSKLSAANWVDSMND